MPDLLPVGLQNLMRRCKSALRAEAGQRQQIKTKELRSSVTGLPAG